MNSAASAASSSAHTAAASSSAARPAAAAAAPARSCSPISLIQFLAARSLGLHSSHLRLSPRLTRPKRKAITAQLQSDEEPPTRAQPTLLPVGSFPPGFFLRPPRPDQLSCLWPRPPMHQRFRLQALFDEARYPRIREHVFLAFDRGGTMLISYTKAEPSAEATSASEEQDRWADRSTTSNARQAAIAESGYTLCFWLFTPPFPLRLVCSIPLFRSLALEGSRPRSEEDRMRAHLGLDLGGDDDEHHYIQLQESTDASCFVLAAAMVDPTEAPRAGSLADQNSKVHVSIMSSPLQPNYAALPQMHFSFVSSIRIPAVELVTIAAPLFTQPAQQCLLIDGADTVQCVQFCMQAAASPPSSAAALSNNLSPPILSPSLDDSADHTLHRASSLLSAAVTRVDWLSDLTIVDARGCLLPDSSPLLHPWTLECELFVRDLCVGVSRRMRDYGLAAVQCEGFRTAATQARTMLLVVETESSTQQPSQRSNQPRFEALLLVWHLERLQHVDRVPLSWPADYMRRLLQAHQKAYPKSARSDAERISIAGAHELAKSLSRPIPASMRRVPINNLPLFSKRSRQLLLNHALPIALVL